MAPKIVITDFEKNIFMKMSDTEKFMVYCNLLEKYNEARDTVDQYKKTLEISDKFIQKINKHLFGEYSVRISISDNKTLSEELADKIEANMKPFKKPFNKRFKEALNMLF